MMLLRALDLAVDLWLTRRVHRWLLRRPTEKRLEIARKAHSRLVRRLNSEDSHLADLAAQLAGGAGEYRPLIEAVRRREG